MCKPSGLMCNYNEDIPKSNHLFTNYTIGTIIGGICFKLLYKIFWSSIINCKKKKHDKEQIKKATHIVNVIGLTNPQNVPFKIINENKLKPKHVERIETKRMHAICVVNYIVEIVKIVLLTLANKLVWY